MESHEYVNKTTDPPAYLDQLLCTVNPFFAPFPTTVIVFHLFGTFDNLKINPFFRP